ncbi:hypothetical protein MS53_0700 [Mycoplasmopsis synoviae 53]|uniref:Uncharacterized protein n=1 Tax=Mycoplasmopsis synoviae (strain 53) TaxID=262723 RepID=Q4A6B5_MYCS5|nr:hypothetical protein MS53_0700 [Mycoplasmopsis synoviae 53]
MFLILILTSFLNINHNVWDYSCVLVLNHMSLYMLYIFDQNQQFSLFQLINQSLSHNLLLFFDKKELIVMESCLIK